jgi:two-component system, cell cycle response regulator
MQAGAIRFEEIKAISALPSPAGLASELLAVSRRANVTLDELARLAQSDPATAGRVIKLANATAVRRPTASISDSITRLGLERARSACVAFTVPPSTHDDKCSGFAFQRFWSQSFARAVALRELSRHVPIASVEEAFACGLIASVGELALATVYPDECATALAGEPETPREDAERAATETHRFGITSVQMTVALLNDWHVPALFVDAVRHTLAPPDLPWSALPRDRRMAALLDFADRLALGCIRNAKSEKLQLRLPRTLEGMQFTSSTLGQICDIVEGEWTSWKHLIEGTPKENAEPPVSATAIESCGSSRDASPATMKILVAEDNVVQRKLITRALQSAGHDVLIAEDGEAALRLTLQHQPQVLVADWQMPRMDGLALCSALRKAKVCDGLYFILVTGDTDEEILIRAFETGVDDFITKPLLPRALQARIKAAQRLIQVEAEIRRERIELRRLSSELGIANRKLEMASLTDFLTDLPNRRFLTQQIDQLWHDAGRQKQTLSFLLIDVDRFKLVNDRYGHAVGDDVLKYLGASLKRWKREGDTVCRYGGEEFAVLLPGTDSQQAFGLAEQLRMNIEADSTNRPAILTEPVTISIGVASRADQMPDAKELMGLADQALYQAKNSGRNRTCVGDQRDL